MAHGLCLTFIVIVLAARTKTAIEGESKPETNTEISCATIPPSNGSFSREVLSSCPYPQLFSMRTSSCEDFRAVACGSRLVPLSPCDYEGSDCTRVFGTTNSLCTCKTIPDLNFDTCKNKPDGLLPWPARRWTEYYIQCVSHRTLTMKCDKPFMIFDFIERDCKRVTDFVNMVYQMSLSMSIPNSFVHLISSVTSSFTADTFAESVNENLEHNIHFAKSEESQVKVEEIKTSSVSVSTYRNFRTPKFSVMSSFVSLTLSSSFMIKTSKLTQGVTSAYIVEETEYLSTIEKTTAHEFEFSRNTYKSDMMQENLVESSERSETPIVLSMSEVSMPMSDESETTTKMLSPSSVELVLDNNKRDLQSENGLNKPTKNSDVKNFGDSVKEWSDKPVSYNTELSGYPSIIFSTMDLITHTYVFSDRKLKESTRRFVLDTSSSESTSTYSNSCSRQSQSQTRDKEISEKIRNSLLTSANISYLPSTFRFSMLQISQNFASSIMSPTSITTPNLPAEQSPDILLTNTLKTIFTDRYSSLLDISNRHTSAGLSKHSVRTSSSDTLSAAQSFKMMQNIVTTSSMKITMQETMFQYTSFSKAYKTHNLPPDTLEVLQGSEIIINSHLASEEYNEIETPALPTQSTQENILLFVSSRLLATREKEITIDSSFLGITSTVKYPGIFEQVFSSETSSQPLAPSPASTNTLRKSVKTRTFANDNVEKSSYHNTNFFDSSLFVDTSDDFLGSTSAINWSKQFPGPKTSTFSDFKPSKSFANLDTITTATTRILHKPLSDERSSVFQLAGRNKQNNQSSFILHSYDMSIGNHKVDAIDTTSSVASSLYSNIVDSSSFFSVQLLQSSMFIHTPSLKPHDLKEYQNVKTNVSRTNSTNSRNTVKIVGITIGCCVAGLFVIIGFILVFKRKRSSLPTSTKLYNSQQESFMSEKL